MLMGKLLLNVNEARITLERPLVLVKRSVTGNNNKISITSSRKAQEKQTARCKEKEDSEVPQYCCSIDCQGSWATGAHQLTETQQWSKTIEIISGASHSVMPTSMCQPVPSLESVGNRNSVRKTIAVGDTVPNEGERLIRGYTAPGGTKNLAMLQMFTNPLCVLSAMCKYSMAGHRRNLDCEGP